MSGSREREAASLKFAAAFWVIIVKLCSGWIDIVVRLGRCLLTAIKSNKNFEVFVGLVIVGNCLLLGLEAELVIGNLQESALVLRIVDDIFTVFFNLELLIRLYLYGWRDYVFGSERSSNLFDAALVLISDIGWMFSLIATDASTAEGLVRSLTAFRTVRLVRLVRVVQRVPCVREVWLLLRGLMQSFRVLFWTIFVITAITYVFAIFGVLLVSVEVKKQISSMDPAVSLTPEELEMLWQSTGGVLTWMYTLIQVLTLDSWNSILRPLMLVAPWAWILFYMYVALAVIVLLNLVTAVIVENAFKYSHLDEEEEITELENQRLKSLEELKTLFACLDDDKSGDITWDEFEKGFAKPEIRQQMEKLEIREDELKPLFDLLDTGDGVLSLEEFFSGVKRMSGTATAKETYQISKRLEHLCRLVEESTQAVETATAMGFQHHQRRAPQYYPPPCEAVRSDESQSDPMTPPLIESLHEPRKFTGYRVSSHLEESERACRVASSTEDVIQRSLDDLARKLDAITEDFRCRCKTMHCQVAESFASTYGNSDPRSNVFKHNARRVHGNDSSSENRSPVVDETAVVKHFGKTGDSPVQTVAPLTCLGATPLAASARGVCEHLTQSVTEHSCKPETISKEADITESRPILPNHRPLQEPRKSGIVAEQVPEPIVRGSPRCANTAVSTLTPLSLPPVPNADLDRTIDDMRILDDVLDDHYNDSA